jgi:hypothetical protein
MGVFYIDTSSGTVATKRQLVADGVSSHGDEPPRPWLRIQGPGDATTMWYAVLRRHDRGIWLGTLVMRHGDHHARLLGQGWEEVALDEIGPVSPSIFSSD